MGYLHIYCGDGKGKTTAAVGLAVRVAGSGKSVLFAQIMKNGSSSEIKVLESIPQISCLYSKKNYGFYYTMNDEQKREMEGEYRALFERVVELAAPCGLVVLDEILSAYTCGLVDREKVLAFLKDESIRADIVLTGRDPAQELLTAADYVSVIQKARHPFDRGVPARKGIEF